MEENIIKIPSRVNSALALKIIPGHFATSHSHIKYYIDMTTMKSRQNEAMQAANIIANQYSSTKAVDTIVCMDGCEVIGAFLAEKLSENGIMSLNSHKTISIITPEVHSNGQLIFRDNLQPMVANKNIILLLASATTGKTIQKATECIQYYGGIIQGISALFSATNEVSGFPVDSIFHIDDIDGYEAYDPLQCPLCKAGEKLDAIVNSYGYSKL